MFTSPETVSAVADVQTIGQLRAALGVLTDYLAQGYAQLPNISTDQGLRASVQKYLDTVNAYAGSIYARQPTDVLAQNYEVGFMDAGRLGLAAGQTDDVLAEVSRAANVSDFKLGAVNGRLQCSAKQAATDAGAAIGSVAAAPFQGITAGAVSFLYGARTILIGAGVVAVLYIFRKPLIAAIGKVGA